MTDIPKTEAQLEAGLGVEKKVTNTYQSSEPPPNVHKINADIFFERVIMAPFPGMLQNVMKEHEFTDSLKRIKEAYDPPTHTGAIAAIPLFLFMAFLLIPLLTEIYYLFVLLVIDIIVFFVILFITAKKNTVISDGKTKKLEETLKEINSTFYSRGVKWSYCFLRTKQYKVDYIEIVTFVPGADDAPRKDDVIYASQGLTFPGVQPSGEPPYTYPAPPPEDVYGETTPYIASSSSSTLNEVYTKEVADDVGDPNPYESYPGDPSNLY